MRECVFVRVETLDDGRDLVACRYCGTRMRLSKGMQGIAYCKSSLGIGDLLERELTRMGITQDRYKEIKKMFGFPPTCSCDKLIAWLNRVGRQYLGV